MNLKQLVQEGDSVSVDDAIRAAIDKFSAAERERKLCALIDSIVD